MVRVCVNVSSSLIGDTSLILLESHSSLEVLLERELLSLDPPEWS